MVKHEHTQGRWRSLHGEHAGIPSQIESRLPEICRFPRSWRLEATARALLVCLKNLIGADSGYISLLERAGRTIETLFIDPGDWFCTVDSSLPMLSSGMGAAAYRSGMPMCTNDFIHSEYARFLPEGHMPVGNVLFAPFTIDGHTTGLVGLANKGGGFKEKDVAAVSTFCELATAVLLDCLGAEGTEDAGEPPDFRVEDRLANLVAENARLSSELSWQKQKEADLSMALEKLRILAGRLQEAQENERRRTSFELHEGVAQAIVVLKMELNSLRSRLSKTHAELDGECERMLQYLDGVIRNVRQLYSHLSPSAVEDLGLPVALRCMVRELGEAEGVKGTALIPDALQDLWPLARQIAVYRILQDAVVCVARRPDASSISLGADISGGFATFSIEGDGDPSDEDAAACPDATDHGIGFFALEELTKLLGGVLVVEGGKARGTRMRFTIPTGVREHFPTTEWRPRGTVGIVQ